MGSTLDYFRRKAREDYEKNTKQRETAKPAVSADNNGTQRTSTLERFRQKAAEESDWTTSAKTDRAIIRKNEAARYLDTARNAGKTVIPASDTTSDDERKKRMAELEAEITATNDLLTRKQAGLARAAGINFQNGDVLQQDRDRLKALQEEYKALERSGEHTTADELTWQIEDAAQRATAASNAVPEVSRNAVAAWRNNPELQSEYNRKSNEYMEAKREQTLLEGQQDLQDYIAAVDEKKYEDTFIGQFGANRQLGRLNQDANEAMSRYIQNPTEENRRDAFAKDELAREFQEKYKNVLDDEGAVLPWITQDAAGYLPQFVDQTKAQIGGGAVGALGGALVGNPVGGAKIGATVATGAESYGQMRGAAYRTMIAAGVDEETAREAANDEAFISSMIEMGETALSMLTLGGNKALDLLTNAAVKSGSKNAAVKAIASTLGKKAVDKAAKTAAKEAGKGVLRKGVDVAGGILLNAGSEALEEALQQGVSIANEDRDDTGVLNLAKETFGTLKDTFSKGNNETPEEINQKITALSDAYNNGEITYEEYERTYKELTEQFERASNKAEIKEAAGGGFRIGLMFGGANTVLNTVVSHVANAKTEKEHNKIVDAVVDDREVLSALVEEGKAGGEKSVSAKIATEIEKTMADGKPVTRQQVEKLIAANEVYIESENKQGAKAAAQATRAADAKKLGYGEHGMAALQKLSERREMAVEEVNAAFHLPYLKGLSNVDMKDAGITTDMQREAFNAGRMDRIANMGKDAAKTVQVSSNAGFDYKSPHIPKSMSKATQDVYNDFSVALGTRTTVLEKIAAGDDESGANAIIMGDGSIGLSADTDISKSPTYFFHEGLHRMKQLAPAETQEFINAVVASTISDGATSSVEAMQNFAAQRNVHLTVESAMEEIAADRAGEMFGGDVNRAAAILHDVMGEIEAEAKKNGKAETEAKAHAKNVVQKFIDAIRSVIQSLKDYLSKNKGRMSEESRSGFEAAIQNLTAEEQLWKDALKAAVQTAQEKVESGNQQEYTGGKENQYSVKEAIQSGRESDKRRAAIFEGSGILHWTESTNGNRSADERRVQFRDRMGQSGATLHQGGEILYGYQNVPVRKANSYAKTVAEHLKRFGVKEFFVFDGEVQGNRAGETQGSSAYGVTTRDGYIGINNQVDQKLDDINPLEVAAHETVHRKINMGTKVGLAYRNAVIANSKVTHPKFKRWFNIINAGYHQNALDFNNPIDRAEFFKEFTAFVGGFIYSGDIDVSPMFEDYSAVHGALEKLLGVKIETGANTFANPVTGENVKWSLREKKPPQNTIIAYKAFYAHDGKLYPPMVSNPSDETSQVSGKVKKELSGTVAGQETPVGVWLDADVGGIGVDEDGNVLRTAKTGRIRVQNDQGGGTLAFRPGWHLGEWPDAKQFNRGPLVPYTNYKGEQASRRVLMPDGIVFAKCEIAADVDYQLEAMEYGMSEKTDKKGKVKRSFTRSQAGLPRVPADGYYKYRTNVDPTTAPWYITGAMRVVEILDDDDCARICAEFGVVPDKRVSGKKINLADYGLKRGPVTPTENVERFKKSQRNIDNEALLEKALNDPEYADAYKPGTLDFDNPEIRKEFEMNKQDADYYRKEYEKKGKQFSLKDSDGNTLTAEQQEFFKDSKVRDENGNLRVVYHGTGAEFTVFDKKRVGQNFANEGGDLGFYFTPYFAEAKEYARNAGGNRVESVYLNLKNPLIVEDDGWGSAIRQADIRHNDLMRWAKAGKHDGIIVVSTDFEMEDGSPDTVYIAFEPEQVKSTENKNPTSDPDIRFSMKSSRESDKHLIALHNKNRESILAAIDLGGFPMPSIAIVKDDMGHEKFGDISVLFRKETISPTDRRNKVYGADAWTPTRPNVGYKVSDKVRERVERKVRKLLEGTNLMSEYRLMLDDSNVNDQMNRWDGDFKIAYKNNEAMKIAFLKDKGVAFKPVMKEHQYNYDADNIVLRRINRALGKGKTRELMNAGFEEAMKQEPLIRKLMNDRMEEQGAPRIYDQPLGYSKVDNILRAAASYERAGATQEVDTRETRTRLEKKFTKKLTAEYDAWLDELFSGIIEKKGIRNDRDPFTPSGNRRSFEQLYMDFNLQNIVKAMTKEGDKGVGVWGTGNIFGAATKEYSSIEEIRADSERLVAEDEETHNAAHEAFSDRLKEITGRMLKPGDSGFGATLDAGDAAVDALLKGKTVKGILRELKSWRRFNATQEIAQDIYDLAHDISEAPTTYFEAKPHRAVGFDEVAAVVMPRKGNADLRARLEEVGVQVLTYNPDKEGDRLEKINSVDGIKFSLKGQSDLLKENAKLKEVNTELREQFKTTKFAQVDKKSLDGFAKKLLQDYSSGADINETRDALNELYTYMANGEDGQAPAWNEVQRRAYETAVSVLEGASVVNDDLYQEYKHLRKRLSTYGMTISQEYDHDLAGYESINEFRKANFGRIKLVKNGTPVDVVYRDLSETYPEFFDDTEYVTQADQLTHIAEVLDSLQPYEVNPHSYNMRESATWLANDIIERFYELPQAKPTFADKAQQKLTKQVIKDAKKLERVRDQKNERIAKLIEQNREKVKTTQAKERVKRAQAVERVREHYEAKEAKASDRRKASLWRKKIQKHVDTISRLLTKGNDNSHVPEEMRTVVSEFLSVIDLTTPRQKEKTINRLNDLRTLYKKIADNETEINVEVDPDLVAYMDEVTAALRRGGDTVSVTDLNTRELEALYRVILAVERSIYTHNRQMAEGKTAEISDLAQRVMIENSASKAYTEHGKAVQWAADMVNMEMLNPQDYFIQLGDTMNDMFQSIRDGFDTKIRHLAEAQTYMDELLDGADVKAMSDRKAKAQEFKTQGGATIRLTPAQVMSLYLLQRQPDALDHIYKGGIKPAPVVALDGKSRRPKVQRAYEVVKVTPEDVGKILESMTPEQKKIADGIGQFFTEHTAKWGNEVSLALYGYKKFTVENYFPIVSDQNYLKDVFGETNDATLKNMGSTKARIKGASNPIIIEDVFDVFSRQADTMSSYNAFVIPLTDIQRVYNFKTANGSVKQSIEKKYGVRATQYFKKLMTDINGGGRWNGGNQLMNEMISRYKQAKLGLNLRVIVQQPTAMLRAQAVIDGKYIAKAFTYNSDADMETIYKYAPVAQWKNWGFFSMDTGKQMKDVILGTKQLSDYTMWAAGKMDEITWKRLWVAAELEVEDKQPDLKVGSEEYFEAVGKRFSEIIDRTQVVDSVLHRSQIMRNPDTLVKMSVSFMNEPFKAYNMVRTAVVQFKNNPTEATKKALWAAGVAYLSTLVVNHLITAMVDTYRGDEDDEEWLEKMFKKITGQDDEEDVEPKTWWQRYWWHFADNAVNEPLSMFPVVKDVVSLVQGYDIKRMDMQGLGDLVNAAKRGLSDKYTPLQKVVDVGGKLGDLFGVPVSSLKREIGALVNAGVGAADSPMVEYKLDRMLYTVSGNKSRFMDILYEAYKQGDMQVYNAIVKDLIDEGITPTYIESSMKSRAKKDGVSVANLEGKVFMVGIEPKYEIEKEDEEKFSLDNLTSTQYTQYNEEHGAILEEIVGEFQRRGFGSLDEETANALLSAAYTYAEETALEDASAGQYVSDTKWLDAAQDADELGMTTAEYIWVKGTHNASITADGVYDAYEAGVDVEDYLTFRDGVNALEPGVDYEKGNSDSRKAAIRELLNSMGLTQDEYDYLFGTEYKNSSGFGGGFGGSFGSGFGTRFGK